jgi:hypothetical protein
MLDGPEMSPQLYGVAGTTTWVWQGGINGNISMVLTDATPTNELPKGNVRQHYSYIDVDYGRWRNSSGPGSGLPRNQHSWSHSKKYLSRKLAAI